jgi:hypothetical protein
MKTSLLPAALLLLGACAENPKPGAESGASAGFCSMTEPSWNGAARDFDRGATLEVIGSLRQVAAADQHRAKVGARADVGVELDELLKRPAPSGFIARGVAQLGVRLRQLDCAVRAGRVNGERANALYAQILAELTGEQAALDPAGGGARLPASP